MDAYQLVTEFHQKNHIGGWMPRTARLYRELLNEEHRELLDQITRHTLNPTDDTLIGVTQEAIDLIYVTLGVLAVLGLDAEQVAGSFREVHRANMTKEGRRVDGKVIGQEGYLPADLRGPLGMKGDGGLPLVTAERFLTERVGPGTHPALIVKALRDGGYLKEGA